MVKLAVKMLKNRKKFAGAIIGVISISMVLTFLANIMAASIYEQKLYQAKKTYGAFICGGNNLTNEDIDKIKDYSKLQAGFFELYQNIEKDDAVFTLGHGDEEFRRMANIEVVSGRWPEGESEIAVEQFVAESYGLSTEGGTIPIVADGRTRDMQVVGIVQNYSNHLDVHYRLEKGVNNYPNILCSADSIFAYEEKGVKSVLFAFVNDKDIGDDFFKATNKAREEIEKLGLSDIEIYDNFSLFDRGLKYCQEIKNIGRVFSALICLTTAYCSWSLLQIFYKDYRRKMSIFMTMGLQKQHGGRIAGIQLLLLLQICGIISLAGSWGLYIIAEKRLFPQITTGITFEGVKTAVMWFALFWVSMSVLLYKMFGQVNDVNIYQEISTGNKVLRKTEKRRKLHYNIGEGMKQPQVNIIVIMLLLFVSCYMVMYNYNLFKTDLSEIPEYQMYAKKIVETESIDGYEIEYNPDSYIPSDAVAKLKEYEDDLIIDSYPNVNSHTLLLEREECAPYFEKWIRSYTPEETHYSESIIKENWPIEANGKIPVPNVEFIIADNAEIQQIIDKYELALEVENVADSAGAILFLPQSKSEDVGIHQGEVLTLGGISLTGENVGFDSIQIVVQGISNTAYSVNLGGVEQERRGITIVVSDKLADENAGFFKGYKAIDVYYRHNNLDEEMKNVIDNCINNIQSKVQGGIVYSKKATQEAEELLQKYTDILGLVSSVIIIVLSGICICTQLYTIIIENEKKYGVLRVLGASADWISDCIIKSSIKSMNIAFLLSLVGTSIIFRGVSLKEKILFMIILLLIGLGAIAGCQLVVRHILRKMTIIEMIEEKRGAQ